MVSIHSGVQQVVTFPRYSVLYKNISRLARRVVLLTYGYQINCERLTGDNRADGAWIGTFRGSSLDSTG